jgi:hypothetical protein
MARSVEFLIPPAVERLGGPMLEALRTAADGAGFQTVRTTVYAGASDWLVLYGVGAPLQARARAQHVAKGPVLLWDLGYFGNREPGGYLRASLNHDHPQDLLDRVLVDGARWDSMGIALREDVAPNGPIVLVGLGRKSRAYLGPTVAHWEERKLFELRCRFPGREVVHRPKRGYVSPLPGCRVDDASSIQELLRGVSLVVCRHSNVAIDAAIAGVPFECEDGAARWLARREFTRANRLEFLRRLAWFQWKPDEAGEAWAFASKLMRGRECV